MTNSWQRMPFGLHKGCAIEDLPDGYLRWLTSIDLRGWLHDAVHREFDRRTQYDNRTPPPPAGLGIRLRREELPLARRLFETGYRNLVWVMHPDKGGDTHDMQNLNGLVQSLRDQLDALEAAK
jgi:hypothetical protein